LTSYLARYDEAVPSRQLPVALVLSEMGRTYCAAGDYARAEPFLRRSLAIRRGLFGRETYPDGHPSVATALRDLGQLLLADNRPDEAFTHFAAAARMEQALAETFVGGGSEALLLNLAARRFTSLDGLLDAWCRSGLRASEVYPYVWRRRGFVQRVIGHRQSMLRAAANPEATEERESYLRARRSLAQALLISQTRGLPGHGNGLDRLQKLNERKEQLEDRLSRQLVSDTDQAPIALPDVRALTEWLPPNTVLVDYIRYRTNAEDVVLGDPEVNGAEHFLAFVIAPGEEVKCMPLGEASLIEDLAKRWRQALLAGRHAPEASKLRRLVWDPVQSCFPPGTDTAYLVPDGPLSLVAWNALPLPEGGQLLIERFTLATVPFGAFLLESTNASPRDPDSGTILAVGDLDFGTPPVHETRQPAGLGQLVWSSLKGSDVELRNLIAAAGQRQCMTLTGDEALRQTIIEQLPHCRYAHFATHGFFVDESLHQALQLVPSLEDGNELKRNRSRTSLLRRSPLVRSGLALSGANQVKLSNRGEFSQLNGILTGETIATVDCSGLELVVLSACESARGDIVPSDGVFGLPAAFQVAGARNVIASLWKIDDQATADLMSRFYQLLWGEQLSPLQALRQAQLQMLGRARDSCRVERGPELGDTVPLPDVGKEVQGDVGARHWAPFMLSGPGY